MKRKKLFCMLLAFLMLFQTYGIKMFSNADEKGQEKTRNCDFEKFPEVVSSDDNEHRVMRLDSADDDLSVIKYYIGDGKCEEILFPMPVKYVDSDNTVRDKSNKLEEKESGFYNPNNDIRTIFPSSLDKGIITTFNEYSITVTPVVGDSFIQSECYMEDNTVYYEGAYGENTLLLYKATFCGNKSDILLLEKPETNCFSFAVDAVNLSLTDMNGQPSLCDKKGGVVFAFDSILVYDAEGREVFGSYIIDENIVTIEVPEDFLNSDDTTYPVTVDPSIFLLSPDYYGTARIQNTSLSSSLLATGGVFSSSDKIDLGTITSSNCQRTLIGFPGLKQILPESASDIESASLLLYRRAAHNQSTYVYVYARPCTAHWYIGQSVSAALYYNYYCSLYTNANRAQSKVNANANATGSNSFNIKDAVLAWQAGQYCFENEVGGFNIALSDETHTVKFHGATTATANKTPRLTLTLKSATVQDGVYMISPYLSATDVSPYTMGVSSTYGTVINSFNVGAYSYPAGKTSWIVDPCSLFKIKKLSGSTNGYTIVNASSGKYLTQVSTILTYSTTLTTGTVWYFLNLNGKYYIISEGMYLLGCSNPSQQNSAVTLISPNGQNEVLWNLKFYMLDVEHKAQPSWTTCGPTSVWMILNYFGVDLTGIGMRNPDNINYGTGSPYAEEYKYGSVLGGYNEYIREIGQYYSGNYSSYGREHVCAAINHYYPGHYSNWQAPCFPEGCTYSEMRDIVEYNIRTGYPIAVLVSFSNPANYPFTNSEPGHFLVLCGLYTDSSGVDRVIVADPYPTSDPNFVDLYDSHSGNPRNPTPAYVDFPLSDLWDITVARSMICNSYTIP